MTGPAAIGDSIYAGLVGWLTGVSVGVALMGVALISEHIPGATIASFGQVTGVMGEWIVGGVFLFLAGLFLTFRVAIVLTIMCYLLRKKIVRNPLIYGLVMAAPAAAVCTLQINPPDLSLLYSIGLFFTVALPISAGCVAGSYVLRRQTRRWDAL